MTASKGHFLSSRSGRRARRWVLIAHLLSVGTWFGTDAVIAVLIGVAAFGTDPVIGGIALGALGIFAVWALLIAGLATLVTGLVLAVGSGLGVTRYWWLVVKLGINVILTLLVLIGLAPTVADVQPHARDLLEGATTSVAVGNLAYPPVVAPVLLVFAVVIAIVKPWGRIRWRRIGSARKGAPVGE